MRARKEGRAYDGNGKQWDSPSSAEAKVMGEAPGPGLFLQDIP